MPDDELICYCFNHTAADIAADARKHGRSTIMEKNHRREKGGRLQLRDEEPQRPLMSRRCPPGCGQGAGTAGHDNLDHRQGEAMKKIEVFDPPMCCPTGVCGPSVDPKLVEFAADLDWLKKQGVTVERYNLAQQPDKFAECKAVTAAMALAGDLCLPIILVDGKIVCQNRYPGREELASFVGITPGEK